MRAKKNRWQVHHDPYDVSRIWVRSHWDGGWIMCYWKHLHRVPVPFGELAWNHARQDLADQGEQPTETAIADAVNALLDRGQPRPSAVRRPAAQTFEEGTEQAPAGGGADPRDRARPTGAGSYWRVGRGVGGAPPPTRGC